MRGATVYVAFVSLALIGVACGSSSTNVPSPTSPTLTLNPSPTDSAPALPSFQLAGIWTGFLKITEATGSAAYAIGATFPFTLRVAGGPQSYSGQFELARYPAQYVNVGVAGGLRDDGFTMLSGSVTFGARHADVSELMVRTDDTTGLNGTIRFGQRGPGFNDRFKAQILSASLQPSSAFPGGAMEGHWVGEALIKACSGLCASRGGSTREVELILKQSGSTLSGHGSVGGGNSSCSGPCWLPLAGSADGYAITSLTGRLTRELPADWSGDRLMVLSDFSATVDDLGRMRATFVYSTEGQYFQGDPNRDAPGATRLTMETVWLTRTP
ncbi:MAG TPA: hypothetical protein VJM31_15265 [Vicinamibacterales bacterium]|nr:hypothetical protein [Vicinamibacterales bacterium]